MGCCKTLSGKIPARHILCFMLFLGFMVTFLLRVNLSLTIVAMVKSTNFDSEKIEQIAGSDADECLVRYNATVAEKSERVEVEGEFDWSEFQQGIILSSFFWGYILFQIPGGRISELWGPKAVFGTAVLMNSVLALALPLAARLHWTLFLVIRALQGLGQGVIFPCLTATVPRWVPIEERSRYISFAIQGCSLGQVVALPLCGWILTTMGWPMVFYTSGTLGLLWYLAWYFLVYNSPDEHPRISLKEKQFLEKRVPKFQPALAPPLPWLTVMKSVQFWVGAIAAVGNDWGFHTFCTFGPKYIKNALGFDLEQSSWLSCLPFLSQYIFSFGYNAFSDFLLKINVNIVAVRKCSAIFSHLGPAICLIVLTFTGCRVILSVIILIISVTLIGTLSSGFFQNPLDIAPNYAGSLSGITNTLGAMTAVISTPLAGAILQANGTKSGWHYIFYIASSIYVITSLPYLFLAKIKLEPWNDISQDIEDSKRLNLKDATDVENPH